MDCTICGKPTLPGAMLCAPCKAALKRARYVTVQEDMRRPSVIDVRRQPRRVRAPAPTPVPMPARSVPDHAAPVPVPAPSDVNPALGRRIFVGIFVVAGMLGSASYFGLRELGAHAGDAATAPASPAAESRQDVSASVAAPRKEAPAPPPPSLAANQAQAAVATALQALPSAKSPIKRAQAASRATFATTNGDPPDAMYVAPEPEKPAPAPPPPPAPDRWQTMRDAQAQCDRQGVIDGLICGQRVKMQYCDGYWGKVPQCQGANVPYER